MSWDVIAMNFGGEPPDDPFADGEPMGTPATIRKRIDKHLPGVKWFDALRGAYEHAEFVIEFSISELKPIRTVIFCVHGGGAAFAAMKAIAKPNKWSLTDCSGGEFLDLEEDEAPGFEEFRAYRDRALPKGSVTKNFKSGKKPSAKRTSKKPAPSRTAKRAVKKPTPTKARNKRKKSKSE